ncbi:MAG: hypothetical protein AAFN10_19775, partial [Bacteroidota bacterium]
RQYKLIGWDGMSDSLYPADKFVLAIQYGFDICQLSSGQTFDSLITINYDSDIFEFKASNLNVINAGNGLLTYGFELGTEDDIRDKMLYLFFDVKEVDVAGKEYIFEVKRRYTSDDACDGKVTFNDEYARIKELVRASHDPNAKQADPLFFSESGPIEIKYEIRFFNDGSTAVEWIMIKDILDKRLDFSTITDIYFSTMGVVPSTPSEITGEPTDNNVFKWIITPAMLPPGGLQPSKGEQALAKEYAYLNFSVKTKAGLAPNTCIPNEAEIFFYETDTTGASRTVVEQVLSCRNVCEQEVDTNEKFSLSTDSSKVIRINEAPAYLLSDEEGNFYFASENFSKAKVVFQECKALPSGGLSCGPIQTRTFCQKTPPPSGLNWGLILLLIITAILIYLTARQSPNL